MPTVRSKTTVVWSRWGRCRAAPASSTTGKSLSPVGWRKVSLPTCAAIFLGVDWSVVYRYRTLQWYGKKGDQIPGCYKQCQRVRVSYFFSSVWVSLKTVRPRCEGDCENLPWRPIHVAPSRSKSGIGSQVHPWLQKERKMDESTVLWVLLGLSRLEQINGISIHLNGEWCFEMCFLGLSMVTEKKEKIPSYLQELRFLVRSRVDTILCKKPTG